MKLTQKELADRDAAKLFECLKLESMGICGFEVGIFILDGTDPEHSYGYAVAPMTGVYDGRSGFDVFDFDLTACICRMTLALSAPPSSVHFHSNHRDFGCAAIEFNYEETHDRWLQIVVVSEPLPEDMERIGLQQRLDTPPFGYKRTDDEVGPDA